MNWESYKKSISELSNKGKGDSFERLTFHYLKNEPQYATKLKEVWLLSDVPVKIHKKLNLPNQDQGIDLICETNEGEYWAVQSKYHEDETTSQTWNSLSTFTGLAFGVCKNISFGLVCTTAERFTKTLKNQDSIGFCTGEVWRSLDESFFDSFLKNRKPKKLTAFKPYNHQKRAIRNAYKHYVVEKESRGKMIMPCGTGKSLTALWIADKLDAKRIIVAVPSLSLIRQTLQVWLRESYAKGWDVDWITVCSDNTVSKMEKDDLAVLTQDLGIPAVTDPKVIASWLRKRHSGRVVVFTTYQSGKAIAEATRLARRNFDLGIMDEAHKTVGKKEKSFAHLLFDENIKISKRVFMTATERRYTGIQDTIVSMDDYDVYGETFEFLSFKDALDEDPPILSDYKIVTVMVGNDEIAELVKTGKFVKPLRGKWDDEIQADTFASLVALRKAIKKCRIKHALSFHSSIARAEAYQENQDIFTELFTDYQKMDTFFVSGKMPTSVRDRHLRDFESSKRALISNARCLTEGVDVPDIDCVLFADPKRSTIDIVQAVGRALRKSEGKKFGYVIVPVVIEKEGHGFEESQAFQSILMTLRALASNDERIIDYFRDRANKKRTKRKIIIEIPEQLAEKIDEKEFVRELELKAWNKLAKLSWRPFEEVREFARLLKLKSGDEWIKFCKGGLPEKGVLPPDIPTAIWDVYKNKGFISMGDFLGTGSIAVRYRSYLEFKDARRFMKRLGLKNSLEWRDYVSGNLKGKPPKPHYIPSHPHIIYKNNGWIDFSNFLGYSPVKGKNFRSYEDAKLFVSKLHLKNNEEWKKYVKGDIKNKPPLPNDIPKSPVGSYKRSNEWINWGDFLGTGSVWDGYKVWLPFTEAKTIARGLGLQSSSDYIKLYRQGKLPKGLPSAPHNSYKNDGFTDYGDFLGYYSTRLKGYRSYKESKKFAIKLNLKTNNDWTSYAKGLIDNLPTIPVDIPKDPYSVYKNKGEWINWGDFLGTNAIANYQKKWLPIKKAKEFVHKLNLKTSAEWKKYINNFYENLPTIPVDIPKSPYTVYKNKGEWINWGDWLGTGKVSNKNKKFFTFIEAKTFAISLHLKSKTEWEKYRKGKYLNKIQMPNELPTNPARTYKNEWISWPDFLGYEPKQKKKSLSNLSNKEKGDS